VLWLILTFFNAAALFLLTGAEFLAMIGAIVLTLRHKPGVKRQDVTTQNRREPATAMEIRKVETGKGL
jgi:NADH-quinone oxidoreductase subunit J